METNEPRSTDSNEQPTPQASEEARPVKKRAAFWRRTGMVLLWLLLIVLMLGFGSGLLIQLPGFRNFVVSEVAGVIENGTNGRLSVGDIQGNLLEGFVLNDVTLRLKTGTAYDSIPLVHVDRIIARYSLLRWLRTNEIGVSSLILQHPVVRLVKFAGDSTWNYSLFTKANTPETPATPFTQIIDLTNLQIQNGSVSKRDYNFPAAPATATNAKNEIDWNDVEIQGIDLDSRFYAHGAISQSAQVHHLQFRETNSGFFVQRFGFSGSLDSNVARIDNAKIVTGHSDLGFSIELTPPKILETGLLTSMQHSSVKVNLNGSVISTYELKQFLPKPLGFLSGSPGIDLTATGEFGKLHIKKLALDFKNQGNIVISGEMNNLHHPDSLTMNLDLRAKNLSNATLDAYVPGLHIPDLTRFGNINITDLTFNGPPQNFHTTFDAKSSGAGDVTADATLDLRRKDIQYHAGLKTNNINLAAFVHNPDFESSITAETQIAGRGTNWKTMVSTITAKTDAPSIFSKYHVSSLDLAGGMNNGTMTVNHLDGLVENGPEVHILSAMAELASPEIPFRFDGSVKNFRLAQVIASQPDNPARVDLDANIAGTAKAFDDVTGTAHLRLFDLAYQGNKLPEDTADITIAAIQPGENKLTLHSSIADLTVDRHFQTGDLIHVLPEHVNALLTAIENRDFPRQEETPPLVKASTDSIDFSYRLQVKDLRSFADFFPQTFLLAQGTISGDISGSANGDLNMTSNGDSLSFILRYRTSSDSDLAIALDSASDSLARSHRDTSALALPKFGSGTPRIHLMPTTFQLALHNLSNDPKTVLGHLDARLDFLTDSVVRLGSALLYHPLFDLTYKNETLDFNASSVYNNVLAINVKGTTHFPNGDFDFALDSLKLAYKNPYFTPTNGSLREFIWSNQGQAHVQLAKNGLITIDTMNIIHPLSVIENHGNLGAQHMSFGGTLNGDSINAWAKFPSFRLEDLRKILPFNQSAKTFDFAKYQGKIRDFQATMSGTLEQPDISAKLFADSMTYESAEDDTITFDSNYVNLEYRDQELRGILDIHVANVASIEPGKINPNMLKGRELRASIDSIPIVIAFKRGPSYASDSARAVSRPLSASIRTTNFPLDLATPFLPPFRKIDGTGNINFTVTGTRQNVQYAGQASVQNGELLVAATNMWYLFGGSLAFTHDSLILQNDSIHNISSDDSLGAATLNGSFTFNGFDITNFDLRLRSNRIMVLSDAAKESLPAAFGPVTINTGGQDFRFYNTFDAPWIAGTINIMSANVTMPQSSNGEQSISSEGIIYETLPPDSIPLTARIDTLNAILQQSYADQAASTQISENDDTLFPNEMKDIYRNDDGSVEKSNSTQTDIETSKPNALAPSFTDKLRMDLTLNTQGTAALTIPFSGGLLGLVDAKLKADLKSGGTLQIERGNDLASHAYGWFDLSPNSTFTFLQTFNITRGTVSFTNDFGNPTIDVWAEYIATHQGAGSSTAQAKIDLNITGTKNHPNLAAYNYLQPTPGGDFELKPEASPDLAEQDAIYFLGTGYFKSDNTSSNNAAGRLLPNLGGQAAANLFANIAGTSSFPVSIRGASVTTGTYAGAQVSGAYGDVTFKVGGANNGYGGYGLNLVTDIPLSTFLSGPIPRNFLFEIQANSNPTNNTAGTLTQQPIFLTKFVYVWHPTWPW